MINFKNTALALLAPLSLIGMPLSADETMPVQESVELQQTEQQVETKSQSPAALPEAEVEISVPEEQMTEQQLSEETEAPKATGPRVSAKFYSAEVIQAVPRLKKLAAQEPDHNKIVFRLEGFPKHQEINLEIKRLASKDPAVFEHKVSFTIDDDGFFVIDGSEYRPQNLIGSSHGYLPGERIVYRFSTADGTISKEISGIPTPAVVKDKDHKVVLRAKLISINPTVYQIILPGFEEGEEYDFKSTSLGETTKAKPKYVKNKPFMYSPSANHKCRGAEAVLEVKRKSGQIYKIRLPWGTALEAYHNEKLIYSPKP